MEVMEIQFLRSTEGKTKQHKILSDKGGIQIWLKVCREKNLMLWSCKKTGENKNTKKGFTNKN
jgi:hypothetical protein